MTESLTVLPTPSSEPELRNVLRDRGCPLDRWGTGAAKTVSHLMRELISGESRLAVDDDTGQLVRRVSGAQLRLRHDGLTLVEALQVFTDGRAEPVRRRDMQASVGEKMQAGEDPRAAAIRALAEELQITTPVTLGDPQVLRKRSESFSYPGLISHFTTWTFDVDLPAEAFREEGYVEVQSDKVSYWTWRPTSRAPF